MQKTYMASSSDLGTDMFSDVTHRDINIHTVTKPISLSKSDMQVMDLTGKHIRTEYKESLMQSIRKISMNTKNNRTCFFFNSQTDTPTIPLQTYTPRLPDLFSNNTHNNTHFSSYTYPENQVLFYYLSQYFNLVSSVPFYVSAAVNPLLYNLMSARYRHAVHSLIHTQSYKPHTTLTARQSTTTL